MFFTCVSGRYSELVPIYKYCIKRVYPNEEVMVFEVGNPACWRFLIELEAVYVHVTDIDILILPHERTHEDYYREHECMGASYVGGVRKNKNGFWGGHKTRICGGHVGLTPEYYRKTWSEREFYKRDLTIPYREFDEVMLYGILQKSGYPIPDTYCFPDGTQWDKEYRDVHIGDFRGGRFKKWRPNKDAMKELFSEPEFKQLKAKLSTDWQVIFEKMRRYSISP